MSELIEWLRAQLDEDEWAARAATPGPWRIDARSPNVIREPASIDWVGVAGSRLDLPPVFTGQMSSRARSQWVADARHIAAWDPARVLAEMQAKRAILDECASTLSPWDDGEWLAKKTLSLLAQPYANRPGWRDEWSVGE